MLKVSNNSLLFLHIIVVPKDCCMGKKVSCKGERQTHEGRDEKEKKGLQSLWQPIHSNSPQPQHQKIGITHKR